MADRPATEPERLILLAYPAYGRYWIARTFSGLAFQMQAVAVGWQIYALTHSTFELGMVGLVQFVPMVLLTLPAGHVADHYDRRVVCAVALAIQAAAIGVLAAGCWGHWLRAGTIFSLVGLIGAARSFERPAIQALVTALVPESVIPKAIAWASSAFQSASIVGPAIGGILFAVEPGLAYAVGGAMALTGVALMMTVRMERSGLPPRVATMKTLFSGVHYIRDHPIILGSISLDLFAVLLGGATALLPAFAHDILAVGARGLGALRAAPAVGSIAMAVILARRPLGGAVGRKMFGAVFVFGLATVVFGVSRSFFLSLAALFVLGAADTVSVVIRGSLVQIETPDEMRGRVGAVNSLFIGTSNQLGEFESGITAAWFGTVWATVLGGLGTLVVAAVWTRLFPGLLAFDRLDKSGPKPAPAASEALPDSPAEA